MNIIGYKGTRINLDEISYWYIGTGVRNGVSFFWVRFCSPDNYTQLEFETPAARSEFMELVDDYAGSNILELVNNKEEL